MTSFKRPLSLALLIIGISSAGAHHPVLGGHADHLWSDDIGAYRSYRSESVARPIPQSNLTKEAIHFTDDYLVESVKTLSGVHDPILANRGAKAGRAAAREYMRKEFESFGFQVYEQAYRSGTNLIAEKAGKSGKFLVVSAHYDSVNNAGADDDATGVVAMLGTARLLRDRELKHGVRFVAFDEEELGLVGSSAYAKSLIGKGEKSLILGDLQMEMMGYNARKDGKFHVISCDHKDSQFMVAAFQEAVRSLNNGLQITEACTDRSDHSSFWKNGMPAIVISENFFGGDSNPCYHRSCDKVDRMHLDYFVKVAEAAANTVLLLVAQ